MTANLSRRDALKLAVAGVVATSVGCSSNAENSPAKSVAKPSQPMLDKWANTLDRTWIGGEYWANPMEDWHVKNGGVECKSSDGNRSVHSLTHRLTDASQAFEVSVVVQQLTINHNDGGAGLRLGINNEIDEYRSSCFVQRGLDIGIIDGQLFVAGKTISLNQKINKQPIKLQVQATPQYGAVLLDVSASLATTSKQLGQLSHLVPANEVLGNIAVVSNFKLRSKAGQRGGQYRFTDWTLSGDAFDVNPERKFGPILWTMYTLSDSRTSDGFVMKMSVFTGPMGHQDNHDVELQVKRDNQWQTLGQAKLDPDAWVAAFRIPHWPENLAQPFRVRYVEKHRDGSTTQDSYSGLIKANPTGRPLRMAAMTCQNDYSFPYAPVAENVKKLEPDLVLFSGDQIYESHGGFGIIREPFEPAIHNYLRKFYQFGWAFREVMRDAPTLSLPDDHDVMQGNLWGKGGMAKEHPELDPTASYMGGYIGSVRFVNAVHKTCISHHPDAYDPMPNSTGISCYYGDMVYGNVGFAILADRQWKSGPEQAGVVVGKTGIDEDPNLINPKINPPNPQLLGQRQEQFLAEWAQDWRGHELKAVISQTVFAGISTHQPSPQRYLKYDFDSNGWPGPARDKAVAVMRETKALHICGDTHLTSLAQYGVKAQRDSNWSFCTPAISAGWPRWWLPDQVGIPHQNRPRHGLAQTGEFIDAFGNKMYVYAVGLPDVGQSKNRYVKAHEKGSGFGFIIFDTQQKTYDIYAYRYLIDVADGNSSNLFDGWPVTIHQDENIGLNRLS
ncbi:alkaline phosphatase D family protein [Neiella sp. HB171785]|uniref:Alkaline phosphatase D family protein n=1 Tax=Neiella litorisoli TaxID=2771431 RepID=A0A8J6R3Z1_9GAMM|nr:alkaline phosphatase D family protein [Neiella litorisoli]MBD1390955.1 alkaline phosphatase D family protein [Neiella litorisoli]